MFVCVMIFANVVLATVYNAYSDSMTNQKKRYFKNRNKGIAAAFNLLANEGEITFDDFVCVVSCLNRSPVVKVRVCPQSTSEWKETLVWLGGLKERGGGEAGRHGLHVTVHPCRRHPFFLLIVA